MYEHPAKRIRRVFVDSDRQGAQIEKYMDMLHVACSERATTYRRDAVTMLLAIATFVLLVTSQVDAFELGPFKIEQGSQLAAFLPTVCAYFFLDMMLHRREMLHILTVWHEAFGLWNQSARDEELDYLIEPVLPIGLSVPSIFRRRYMSRYDHTLEQTTKPIIQLSILVAPWFQVYAFYALFRSLGLGNVLVWINLLMATATTLVALLLAAASPWKR